MDKDELVNKLMEKGMVYPQFTDKNIEYFINPSYDIPQSLHFHNVAILQNKNICKSRLDVDISSEVIRGVVRPIPLIAANMLSVVDSEFLIEIYRLGALGILHRAAPQSFLVKETKKIANKCEWVAVSIGIGDDQYELAKKLIEAGANIINIDIAHGFNQAVIDLGRKIKKDFNVKIILGNTHNINMYYETKDFCDALKVGLSNGGVCSTKNTAACSEGQFTSVLKFKDLCKRYGMPIISDGGIKESADFCKAIAAGSNSVMAGSVFARCPESAGEIVEVNGERKKIHFGMASSKAQQIWKGGLKKGTCAEGKVSYLDIGEPLESLLERYSGALRSGITYGGGNDIKSFQEKVKFTRI
ncbi:MAG: guanosine monophosphate reductase [Nanoarchaeota archaeon]|nr:guanosine monophosphate reductase [Nanoarchaeota archaeon]